MSDDVDIVSLGPRIDRRVPLSAIQERIWTSQRLTPDAPLANMATAHHMRGSLDPAAFVTAVDAVVRASDALRTVVDDRPGKSATAQVLHESPATTEVIDLPAEEFASWSRQRISAPVDATRCAYDSVLLRHADDDWTWWFDLHHVVTDGWASMLVFDAVAAAYRCIIDGDEVDIELPSFYDHATAATDTTTPGVWDDVRLDGVADGTIAPYGPRGRRTTEVTRHDLGDVGTTGSLSDPPGRYRTFSSELTTTTLLATVAAVTISRLDGRRAVTLGLPVHHRSGAARSVIGPLMGIAPLPVEVDPGATFGETFDAVHRSVLTTIRRTRDAEPPDVAFDAVINVQTAGYVDFADFSTTSTWHRSHHVEAAHPIRLHAYDYGDGLRTELDLNRSLSADGTHAAFPQHLSLVLDAAIADPDAVVGDVDLLTADDRAILASLNPPPLASRSRRPVHDMIAENLRADPDHVVAEHDGVELSAGEFDERAARLAGGLIALGITPGRRVGVRLPRCLDVLVAIHGVLRAGAAFVILDPDDPPERHDAIIDDAEIALVIDDADDVMARASAQGASDPNADALRLGGAVTVGLDDLAYVIYTSGSTGTPKGVPISHRGLTDYLVNSVDAYPTRPGSDFVMPLHSALVFDLSITSLFLPQLIGGRTVVVSGDPLTALSTIAADRRITVIKATPSQLEILTRLTTNELALEVVIVGGEAFRRPVAEAVAALAPGVRIFNEYGPAEAVVGCMIHEWDPDTDAGVDVPIGRATPGAEIHVLDDRGRLTPPGAWGELHVWRTGMADGYLGLPEATQEKFAPVDGLGARVRYRTGDRVRVEGDVLVYGGRIDDQLSVSGVRLEPGEIEAALLRHPGVSNAIVRVWTPTANRVSRCDRCGLGDDVPGVTIADGICSVCVDFDRIEPQTRSWFRTTDDLDAALAAARERATGDIDCLHLLSGGKDSTYALYQLVERGWRVHALTLDNGFISDGAKENVRRSIADLGITHEFVTTEAMDEIFRDSLDRFANVCNGCYKTIYTLATARAHEMGIPVIVTGLSRGQFFETRLVPHQFEADRFDPEAIDRTVLQARRAYHATRDAVTELLPEQAVFERTDIDVLSEIEYLDFYRYVDVELAEMYEFLENRAPWVRPDDTGRSTNCLVNVVGIHTHQTERGYHSYAEPYSWDVRLGHKTRTEALDELDDDIDPAEIEPMLDQIGYRPERPSVLTAWYQTDDGEEIGSRLLAAHLREILPARAIPTAFVHVGDLPLADSTKLDIRALPAPSASHLGSAAYVEPETETEAIVADIWARVLDVERVGADDDFFDLGGASLVALETVAATERRFDVELPDALVFEHRRVREFAAAVDALIGSGRSLAPIPQLDESEPAPLSPGEEAMLFEYRAAPHDVRYNGMRHYTVPAAIDLERLRAAVHLVVERHQPLHTAYDEARTRLTPTAAASVETVPDGPLDEFIERQRGVPFDLDHGPLVRVHVADGEPGTTNVIVAMHHISVDAGTFDVFWNDVDAAYHGGDLPVLETTYAAHGAWQRSTSHPEAFPLHDRDDLEGVTLPPLRSDEREPDGYLDRAASVTASELRSSAIGTPFGAALAAVSIVLAAYSRDGAVELGVTSSTKDHPAVEPVVGYFLNSLPLMVDVGADRTLAEVDELANDLVRAVLPHRAEPFADIVRASRRDGRPVPDISHMLAYERLAPSRFGDDEASLQIVMAPTAVNDLTFFVHEQGDDLRLGLEHRGRVVPAALAELLLHAFDDVLVAICRTPGRTVTDTQRSLVAPDLVGPALDADPVTPTRRVLEIALERPDDIAVVEADGSSTSYTDLVRRGNLIAEQIGATLATLGSVSETAPLVGVCLPRSSRLVEAIIGVHLAGAVYVPIDPSSPTPRIRALLDAAGANAVIVDGRTAAHIAGADGAAALIDVTSFGVERRDDGGVALPTPEQAPAPDAPAYVIFTSGSTGEPAGVQVSHANLGASTAARAEFYGAAPRRFLVTPSIGFDSSFVGIFWPLATGGTIVMPGDDDVHDVDRLGDLIDDLDVTHVLMVPSLYQALLDRRSARLAGLHVAIVAGEACHGALVRRHHQELPGVELVNEYGPTEATVWATAHRCLVTDDPVPIGLPIAGCTVRLADDRQHPMGSGAPGELLIAGPGVVDGYLSGRSNDVFVDDGEHRWYRTGDLAHLDAAGRLVFLGRVDDQLNVGGLRIEPLEIEAVISEIDGIDDVVVTSALLDGRESLVAHVVGDSSQIDVATIRTTVADRLGRAATPRRIGFHEAIPRTSNGKLDRDRATLLELRSPGAARVATMPNTGPVIDIWRDALGRDDVDGNGDFFELGGDSLAAVAIVNSLGDLVGRDVPVAALLTSPTPDSMAAALDLAGTSDPSPSGPDRAGPDDTPVVTAVTLRTGVPGGPTVVMTPAWDSVMGYHALANAFPDHVRVIAVVVTDVEAEGGSSLVTVPELGAASIDVAVDAIAAHGAGDSSAPTAHPLLVLGWSIGGVAAYDLGQRLADRGVEVASVVLVDTFFPGEHHHLWSNRWWKYKSLLRAGSFGEIGRELLTMGRRRVDKLAVKLGRRLMTWGGEPAERRRIETTGSGVPRTALDGDLPPTDLPVLLFAADTTNPKRTIVHWQRVAARLRIVAVRGRHRGFQSVMGADRVDVLADHLVEALLD